MADPSRYLTVSGLNRYVKRKFQGDPYLKNVYVRGEVSNFKPRGNYHQYFRLKDDQAEINVVMFRQYFQKLPFTLENGMEVILQGEVSLYEKTGLYQITVQSMELAGVGALYQALDQRIKEYQAAGLFEVNQRPLARYPKKIAVITSPFGAVIRDILTTIKRRYPIVAVTVFPSRVQGQEAVEDLLVAFDQVAVHQEAYDFIILARGGGSIEDLWCFNETAVADAILKSPIPVIASIGHETDTTLAELVADLRMPTPTAAAEVAVPVLTEEIDRIQQLRRSLYVMMNQRLDFLRHKVDQASQARVLTRPDSLYQAYSQTHDHLTYKLENYFQRIIQTKKDRYQHGRQSLAHFAPWQRLQDARKERDQLDHKLGQSMSYLIQGLKQALGQEIAVLEARSPLGLLSQGYALAEHSGGRIQSVDHLELGEEVRVRVHDGSIRANITEITKHQLVDQGGSHEARRSKR